MGFTSFKDQQSRCPICYEEHRGDVNRLSYKDVKGYIESFGYKLLSTEYINNRTKLLTECPNGHKYEVIFDSFQQGHRCYECNKEILSILNRLSYEDVRKYIENFGYILLSEEYRNNKSKLLIKCDKNHEFMMRFDSFVNGNRCPYCYGNVKYTYEEIKKYIESFEYTLLSTEYKNNKGKLLIKCPNGHIWETKYNSFQQGHRCPICNISKGEQRIINYLNNENIEYVFQKEFEDLLGVGNGLLSYDFYLPQYNLLIEYQGQFHDGSTDYQTEEQFEKQQEHDKRKREYAEKNNIKLLEIWYWDFDNIEKILNKRIKSMINREK